MRLILLLPLLALPLCAAEPSEKERLDRVKAEVERRRVLREQALEKARRLVRDHESGLKPATAAELAEARAAIRADDERRTKAPKLPAVDKNSVVELHLPDASVETVANAWRMYFGPAAFTEAARLKRVTMKFPRQPLEELRPKMIAALRDAGIRIVDTSGGVLFCTAAEADSREQAVRSAKGAAP